MAKQKDEGLFKLFDDADKRLEEHRKMEGKASGIVRPRKRGVNATTMTLSVSQEDKERVKVIAAERSMTVSDLFHHWADVYFKTHSGKWNSLQHET